VILTIGERQFGPKEIVAALHQHNLLPQLIRELVIDAAIEGIECTETEQQIARSDPSETIDLRQLKIEKFKQQQWGDRVESYFLERKTKLDRAIYSLLRTKDVGMAQELYCRLLEEEASFEELARQYSQGPEAKTGGLVGPVELSNPHPTLAKMLSIGEPGKLWPPTLLKEWYVIVRLEKFIPAQLDEKMRQQMLDEQFQLWLREQVQAASTS